MKSDPAKSETTVALAEGSTSVAQVCSEECMAAQARPRRTATITAIAGDRDSAASEQAARAEQAPSAINREVCSR